MNIMKKCSGVQSALKFQRTRQRFVFWYLIYGPSFKQKYFRVCRYAAIFILSNDKREIWREKKYILLILSMHLSFNVHMNFFCVFFIIEHSSTHVIHSQYCSWISLKKYLKQNKSKILFTTIFPIKLVYTHENLIPSSFEKQLAQWSLELRTRTSVPLMLPSAIGVWHTLHLKQSIW
jgi:hypothetical protein